MKFSQEFASDAYRIHAFDEGKAKVIVPLTHDNQGEKREMWLEKSFIIGVNRLDDNWRPGSLEELEQSDFDKVLPFQPQVLLLGVGKRLRFPKASLYQQLIEKGIGVEVMDSAAACRTYNILVNEGREVVAAIILD